MALLLALPHADLADFIDSYGTYDASVPRNNVFVSNLIAFNPSHRPFFLDGEERTERALFCITHEPAQVEYESGGGTIFFIRMRGGAFDRLLHLDPLVETGIVVAEEGRHAPIMAMADALESTVPPDENAFPVFDEVLRLMVDDAKPGGLAQRYFSLVSQRDGDLTIAEATEALGCTARTLERACKRRFGRTPKRLARGFRAAATYMRELAEGGRPETAQQFAYADLAHYSNDLRALTGLTRSEHFRQSSFDALIPLSRVWPDGRRASSELEVEEWLAEYRTRANRLRQ